MKRKKILIVSHFMHIGGAERALLGLLEGIDQEKYEVDLFLFRHEGELLPYIPDSINLLPTIEGYTMLACPVKSVIKKRHFVIAAARVLGKIAANIYSRWHKYGPNSAVGIEYSHKFTRWFLPKINPGKKYDLAISFLTPHYFVADKVTAKTKIAWIHTDYSTIQIDTPSERKMWDAYDYIVSISALCSKAFAEAFPSLAHKLVQIENPIPIDSILHQADEEDVVFPDKKCDQIALLSIGRFCEAKNFDNVPDICRRIRQEGIDVIWYLIGFGNDEGRIREQIKLHNMETYVVILGKKENPYPYIRACDWYIQPSRFEGKAVTVSEALALHKPVIITAYPTAQSQLRERIDGLIVPLENAECAHEIAAALKDKQLRQKLIGNTYLTDYSGRTQIEKLYALMED